MRRRMLEVVSLDSVINNESKEEKVSPKTEEEKLKIVEEYDNKIKNVKSPKEAQELLKELYKVVKEF
jgi:antitoxin component of RelBE/YafQ-DinJ toxin-antitoxin module